MGTISIIKQSELMSAVNGKFKTYLLLYLGLPFLIIACLFGVIVGENAFIKTISLFGAIFFGVGCYVFLRGEQEYKPGKSFPFLRHSKEKIRVLTLYIGIAAIVMLILFFVLSLLSSSNSLSLSIRLLLGIPVFLGLIYYTNKSCQVHEDVDFATCAEMESIIGVENYEKIQATYQNFDTLSESELEDGCNMIMVTDKKIYFAFYESGHWSYVNKRIDEISRLGSMGTEDKYYFKLDFHDSTSIILH